MKKSYDKYKKYDFSKNKDDINLIKNKESKNFFQNIKEWIFKIYDFLLYQWKNNRLQFLLILSLLFIFGYYIYVNYIKDDEDDEDDKNKNIEDSNKLLESFVKTSIVKKKKSIPKKHETRCRIILEKLFRAPFITVRPDFLKYDKTGKNLELDMFNQELMLALEYDGVHHRKYTEFFHKSEQDFIDQKNRDHFKEERCKELGITLIRVPDTVKYDDLEEYIKNELDKRGIFYLK
jgi:hypothetical protein